MSVDLSGEITAIATAILAALAIVTAVFAFLAFRKQAAEVGILQQQMKEQQDLLAGEALERHRAQAAQVFIGATHSYQRQSWGPHVVNASNLPVYDARLWYPYLDYHPIRDDIGVVLPGETLPGRGQGYPEGTNPADMEVVLTFRDAAGTTWMRTRDGTLTEHPLGELDNAAKAALETVASGQNTQENPQP